MNERFRSILRGKKIKPLDADESALMAAMNQTLNVVGTLGEDKDENVTITFDKTALELYSALKSGKRLAIVAQIDETTTGEFVVTVDAFKFSTADGDTYQFRFVNQDGNAFGTGSLSEDDAVVLTAE